MASFPPLLEEEDFEDEQGGSNGNDDPQQRTDGDGMALDDDDFDLDDDDDIKDLDELDFAGPASKRRRLTKPRRLGGGQGDGDISDKQRRMIRIQRAQDEYYKLQYYALNSSGILYLMARSVQKDDNDMLWNAILGLTESYILERIKREQYNGAVATYCDEVKRRNETYNSVSTMDSEARYNLGDDHVENSTIITHRRADHIQFSTEFRFTLMRFWTLYDSMYYSRYVATRMGVWKQRGKDNLKYMLAKMALPLNEAQQPYTTMRRQYKANLPKLFEEHGPNEGLDENMTFGSFTKQHGGHQSISAADMVYAITAVLESDFKVKHDSNEHTAHQNHGGGAMDGGSDNAEEQKADDEGNLALRFDEDSWQSNFFYGYDALGKDNQILLRQAIKLAKERQREITDMGIKLIERRDIKSIGIMRHCKIDNSNRFQSPMVLCKLALFIMDAYKAQTTKNAKHFVLASYNDKSNSYTVVGIPAKRYVGDVQKSPFYQSFEEARQRVKANAKIVFFEGHVIQIHKDHFTDWLENLHERLMSYAF